MPFKNKTIDLGFVLMELTEHCVVAAVQEGVLIEMEHIEALHRVFKENYPDRPFGYIDNREHQFAINLKPELYNTRYPNMVGLAIVCYTEVTRKNANFEKSFYNWPFEVFGTLEEAKKWISQLIAEASGNP